MRKCAANLRFGVLQSVSLVVFLMIEHCFMSDFKPAYSLSLTNSLTLQKEPFSPANAPEVRLYVCGPTVYDHAHLGHARCYLTWDVLVRFLTAIGYQVRYARNITDVDDKIINRAREQGCSHSQIAQTYAASFHEDMATLNLLPPTDEPKATDHMSHIIDGTQSLIESGHAYVTQSGTVYYRTSSKNDYGKLSRKPLDELKSGARVEEDPEKESPLDFALWKAVAVSDGDSDTWESPWGKGRPGWHMECSAMNAALFDSQLDIHAGGADLIFPHHENEIAQSEAWSGHTPFSTVWLHNGFVNVDGEKMSKSLGNFSTIKDVLKRYDANVLRYFLLAHHYRMPVNFSPDGLDGAQNRMTKIHRALAHGADVLGLVKDVVAQIDPWDIARDDDAMVSFAQALADDLNTPQALAVLDASITDLNRVAHDEPDNLPKVRTVFERAFSLFMLLGFRSDLMFETTGLPESMMADLQQLASQQGLTVNEHTSEGMLNALVNARFEAKQSKNWALADALRNGLTALGVLLSDSAEGTTWEYLPQKAPASSSAQKV